MFWKLFFNRSNRTSDIFCLLWNKKVNVSSSRDVWINNPTDALDVPCCSSAGLSVNSGFYQNLVVRWRTDHPAPLMSHNKQGLICILCYFLICMTSQRTKLFFLDLTSQTPAVSKQSSCFVPRQNQPSETFYLNKLIVCTWCVCVFCLVHCSTVGACSQHRADPADLLCQLWMLAPHVESEFPSAGGDVALSASWDSSELRRDGCSRPATRRLLIWFELAVFMLFNRIFWVMCHSLQSVTWLTPQCALGVHHGCLNRDKLCVRLSEASVAGAVCLLQTL